jgi:tetratricopeptide (TPR) repeat protein
MSVELRSQLQKTLGDAYRLERELGGGGMSRVFVAEETRLQRKVVVKVLSPDLAQGISVDRFEREIKTVAGLQQANIVPVITAGDTEGLPFYTMPFVEGESLRARLARGPMTIAEVVSVLKDVTKALGYAHGRGVVHRDIKPDNVLISGGTAVVTDFGIAKAISASRTASGAATLTQIGTSIGTPAYMAPEQAAGDADIDHRADVYSLGAMAYELLTGQIVFPNRTPQRMLAAHMSETPKPVAELRPDTPAALADLVMQCLAKEAGSRPQDAGALLRSLETTSGAGLSAMPPVLIGGAGMFRKALAIYAGAFVVVAVVAKAAIVGIGLPDWVFPGSLIVMALGLPVILWTGYVQRVTRRAMASTPTYTPGGTPSMAQGTIATMALRAAPHVSWYKTARGGMYAFGVFIAVVAVFMVMRAFGIGPAASLITSGKFGQRERVILTDFKGPKTDSLLGQTVTDAFRTDIGQSANLVVMPVNSVRDVLRRMQRPADTHVDFAVAREIATREGLKAVIDGDVVALGGSYVLSVRLVSAQSGEELAALRETAADGKEIIPAISRLSRDLRSKVGESLRQVQNTPSMERVSTPSLDALQKYVAGTRANDLEGDFQKSRRLLEEAVAIDTGFAMAYRRLTVILSNRGVDRPKQIEFIQKAYDHRDRLSDPERYNTVAMYYSAGPNPDAAKTIAAYESLLELDSNNVSGLNNLALEYSARREYAKAEPLYRRTIALDPSISVAYANLAIALVRQNKIAEADKVSETMSANLPRNPATATLRRNRLYSKGDIEGAWAVADSLRKARTNDAATQAAQAGAMANYSLARGQLALALKLRQEGSQINSTSGNPQAVLNAALHEPEFDLRFRDQAPRALKAIEKALASNPLEKLPPLQRPYGRLITLYTMAGRADLAKAARKAAEDAGAFGAVDPVDLAAANHYFAGTIAVAEKRYDDAVKELWAADNGPCAVCALPEIARTLDLAGKPDSAIALYERYTSSAERPIATDASWLPASHKRVAELYEAKGDAVKAAEHYRKFIALWEKADPELQPQVAAARQKLAKLAPVERPR